MSEDIQFRTLPQKGRIMNADEIAGILKQRTFVVGLRQTVRALRENSLDFIIAAENTDKTYASELRTSAYGKAKIEWFPSKKELGRLADIKKACGVIGIIK
jgi:ribosomal protein L7Ae-like RNA K-turn-binding protein